MCCDVENNVLPDLVTSKGLESLQEKYRNLEQFWCKESLGNDGRLAKANAFVKADY